MDVFNFYRLDFSIRNLGIGVISVFSVLASGQMPSLFYAFLALVQILLIQMHSFSMNHYFDYKVWKEKNYIGKLIENGFQERKILFLTLLPLLILVLTLPFSNKYVLLLFLYVILFFLYQSPQFRLKKHYLWSIILNSVCLGWILYAYPYLFLTGSFDLVFFTFSVIFLFYMAFQEIVHQIAHINKDKIYSLPQATNIKTARNVAAFFLLIPAISAVYTLMVNPFTYLFFTGTILFSILRIYKLSKTKLKIEEFKKIRNRWDKFYSFQEAIYYMIFLSLVYLLR